MFSKLSPQGIQDGILIHIILKLHGVNELHKELLKLCAALVICEVRIYPGNILIMHIEAEVIVNLKDN